MTTMMLQDADLLIDDPDRWVQGHYSTKDERRCAMGALLRAYYETRRYPGAARAFIRAKKYLHDAVAEYGYRHVEAFNDNMPYEAVRCVFADAISRSRQ